MKNKLAILLSVILSVSCFGQTQIPDAPSVAARSIFWSAAAASVGATIFDEHVTIQGLYHSSGGCSEANGGDPFPSPAKAYAKNLAITGAAIGAGYLITRLPAFRGHPKLAAFIGATIPAIVTVKHVQAGHKWYTFKNGACLD